jgi:hypothetical protein
VWDEPLVKLAKRYRISDVRVGKVCRRLQIPLPGRGYWAKRKTGKPVVQPPLTAFEDAPIVRRLFYGAYRVRRSVQRFGTISVQLSERKSGTLFPKRHQIKHLEFVVP